jgi:hypothetical protein
MKQLLKISASIFLISGIFLSVALTNKIMPTKTGTSQKINSKILQQPKIQVAILLDVSGSMDGLIDQAKTQLWNMVNTIGKAKCENDIAPQIEIALYEYGRTNNDAKKGYVKMINSFIGDLDSLSQNLFSLKTNGGEEYCGRVIYSSLNELQWDASNDSYKVIFIAGNESFLQGDLPFIKACTLAKEKGIIVNTIFCGDKMQGIREHWNLGGECGNGSYTNINQNAKEQEIPTPYDSALYVLNEKLNNTYISYGAMGYAKKGKQAQMDQLNKTASKSASMKRITVKGKQGLYKNDDWDLVDGYSNNAKAIEQLDMKTLPDSLQNKSKEEIKILINKKGIERNTIQKEIANTSIERDKFIAEEKTKNTSTMSETTLETEVEKIIKVQAARFKITIQ